MQQVKKAKTFKSWILKQRPSLGSSVAYGQQCCIPGSSKGQICMQWDTGNKLKGDLAWELHPSFLMGKVNEIQLCGSRDFTRHDWEGMLPQVLS